MTYLLDTDIIVEYLRNNMELIEKIEQLGKDKRLSTTTITLCELYYGVYKGSSSEKHLKAFFDFVSCLNILTPDLDSCVAFGQIKNQLRNCGKMIGDFDIVIASIAVSNNLSVVTRNIKHYENIEGLKIECV